MCLLLKKCEYILNLNLRYVSTLLQEVEEVYFYNDLMNFVTFKISLSFTFLKNMKWCEY